MPQINHQLKGKQPVGGMIRPKRDPRHFSFSKKFGSTPASNLPIGDRDVWIPLITKNQGISDLCTDYGVTGATEPFTGLINDEAFQRAAHNAIAGTPGNIGAADPDQACLAAIRYGLLPRSDAPFSVNDDATKFADLSAYPSGIITEAGARKEISKYDIDGQDDLFDSIRAAMFITAPQNGFVTVPMIGAMWRESWLSAPGGVIVSNNPNEASSDHEFVIVGQKIVAIDNGQGTPTGQLCLKAHLSSGTNVGDNGFFYFPRSIVNTFLFAKAFGPGNPNDYKDQLWTTWQKIYDILYNTFFKPKTPVIIGSVPVMTLPQAKQWARNICAQVGLDAANTNILIACVMVESGFNRYAINMNKNPDGSVASIDYGIAQINDIYHMVEAKDFPSPEYVLSNPDACIRWMAQMFKAGHANLWSSFESGAYKQYLNQ